MSINKYNNDLYEYTNMLLTKCAIYKYYNVATLS